MKEAGILEQLGYIKMKKTAIHSPHTPKQHTLERTHTFNESNIRNPQKPSKEGSQGLQLNSQLVCYNIASLQSEPKRETQLKEQYQSLPEHPLTPQVLKQEKNNQRLENKCSSKAMKSRLAKGPFVTVMNFQRHLREFWQQDKSLDVDDLMHMGHKLLGMMQEGSSNLINLNKYWCSRLLQKLKGQQPPPSQENHPSSSFYEMFSEPESCQMETSVVYTSESWKKHSLQLLSPQAKSQNWDENLKVLVQKQMAKTMKNRKIEMERLRKELKGGSARTQPKKEEGK